MKNTQVIAERIKSQAKLKGLTVKLILESCELGVNTVTKMSNGTDIFSQNLLKIADYLDCSVDYLLGRTTEPSINTNNNTKITNGNISNGSVVQTNGNINQQYIGGGASANTTHDTKKTADSISEKFMEIFNNLPFEDQLSVMNFAVEKSKK